tara:strand:- start:1137 stop:1451 length:315 start_codon:yes stop_codon:yes gene_type:complete
LGVELTYKPGSVMDNHSSRFCVATKLKQPTQVQLGQAIEPLFGLAPEGVYHAINVTIYAVRSYRTFSPLPTKEGGLTFCGTFRRFTSPRCYLASCPWSPDFPLF